MAELLNVNGPRSKLLWQPTHQMVDRQLTFYQMGSRSWWDRSNRKLTTENLLCSSTGRLWTSLVGVITSSNFRQPFFHFWILQQQKVRKWELALVVNEMCCGCLDKFAGWPFLTFPSISCFTFLSNSMSTSENSLWLSMKLANWPCVDKLGGCHQPSDPT